ncbi:MAG: hypothetical protein H6709_11295 [Kofleriaceae bacterium]|nr:hypothetical protein [Myxococcales bacterium]MCB9563777.1 hypothetical protein [Kofleriaceae bacterium]MCB9572660.1 hypothetical protein [Kofleriaceae bacterium]
MSAAVTRPSFVEGQVLAAADLEAQVAYARLDSALHERAEHGWGVAQGLELRAGDKQKAGTAEEYVEVTLAAGVAVAPNGRRIVVSDDQPLRYTDFRDSGVFSSSDAAGALYPVYVVALDEPRIQARGVGSCGTAAPNRTDESFQIEYGRPGDEVAVLAQVAGAIGAGPEPAGKVLVGYVAWNKAAVQEGRFARVAAINDQGNQVRYVGVRASAMVGHVGGVSLQTREGDPRFVLAMVEDGQGGCKLSFGRQQGNAPLSSVFSVDEKGDVKFAGEASKLAADRRLAIASGTTFHGLKVPLPAGVTEADVTAGAYRLHVDVQPIHEIQRSGASFRFALPMECRVDGRRVVTSISVWFQASAWPPFTIAPRPCRYQIVAVPT